MRGITVEVPKHGYSKPIWQLQVVHVPLSAHLENREDS
jgi:hypothetical protein